MNNVSRSDMHTGPPCGQVHIVILVRALGGGFVGGAQSACVSVMCGSFVGGVRLVTILSLGVGPHVNLCTCLSALLAKLTTLHGQNRVSWNTSSSLTCLAMQARSHRATTPCKRTDLKSEVDCGRLFSKNRRIAGVGVMCSMHLVCASCMLDSCAAGNPNCRSRIVQEVVLLVLVRLEPN